MFRDVVEPKINQIKCLGFTDQNTEIDLTQVDGNLP